MVAVTGFPGELRFTAGGRFGFRTVLEGGGEGVFGVDVAGRGQTVNFYAVETLGGVLFLLSQKHFITGVPMGE